MENQDYILFLTKWYPNEKDPQLGVFVKKHAHLLSEKYPVKTIYICPFWDSSKPKLDRKTDGNYEEVTVYFKPFNGWKKVLNPYLYYKLQKEIYMSFQGKAKHCFVNVGSRSGFLAYYYLRKLNIPYSIIEHWSGFVNGKFNKKSRVKKSFYKKLCKKAKSVFAVSNFLRDGMSESINNKEIQILPNVIETIAQMPQSFENRSNMILSVGDLVDEVKNFSGLIRAFDGFNAKNSEYELWIIGGGDSEHQLKNLCKEQNIADKVKFLGRLENKEVLKLLQKAKIYVCNSRFETFGMTVAEALKAGVPVVSTKCGGPDEFLNPSNSIQIEIDSEKDLEQALLQMTKTIDKYDRIQISNEMKSRFEKKKILELLEADFNSP